MDIEVSCCMSILHWTVIFCDGLNDEFAMCEFSAMHSLYSLSAQLCQQS